MQTVSMMTFIWSSDFSETQTIIEYKPSFLGMWHTKCDVRTHSSCPLCTSTEWDMSTYGRCSLRARFSFHDDLESMHQARPDVMGHKRGWVLWVVAASIPAQQHKNVMTSRARLSTPSRSCVDTCEQHKNVMTLRARLSTPSRSCVGTCATTQERHDVTSAGEYLKP